MVSFPQVSQPEPCAHLSPSLRTEITNLIFYISNSSYDLPQQIYLKSLHFTLDRLGGAVSMLRVRRPQNRGSIADAATIFIFFTV